MKITSLQNRVRTIKVTLPDELGEIDLTYRAITSSLQDRFGENRKKYEDGNQVERAAADLADLIVSWDVADDDGPVPPTLELLRTFDLAILNALSTSITEAQFPPRKAGSPSGASS